MQRETPPPGRRVLLLLVVLAVVAGWPARADAQLNTTGQWQLLSQTMPINPIHAALLRTGRILVVAGSENDPTVTTYRAAVFDPVTGTVRVQTIPWDLFCNAMSFLPDGRVLTTGGNLHYNPFTGVRTTTIFDPATEQFTQAQDMTRGRWYPSNVGLADGSTMTFSGWLDTGGTNNAVEIYRLPTGWTPEAFAPFTPPLYPWLHLLPNGRVFESGAQSASHIFDPSSQTWTTNVAKTSYGQERDYGSSVLLPLKPSENYRARVMIMGGWPGGSAANATASAEIIDLSQATPVWRNLPPMSAPRVHMNAVLLPTGKVLALGGSASNETESTASLNADLFDPAVETWSPAGTMFRSRMYHSVALLLPDATVWVAGSNPYQGSWDNTMELYRPPYLFTASGAAAPRPTITAAPSAIGYNASVEVRTPDAASIASVALVRAGSATHAFNFEQRLVNLSFTAGSGTLTLTSPPNANIAPPGYYMLFLINSAGVPSVAAWMQITPSPGNRPPVGSIDNPSSDVTIRAGQSVTFAGSGTDADGAVTSYAWVFPGGTPTSASVATPGAVVFSTPGVYGVSLLVTDNVGASDPSPPVRRITVQPATITASFTSPSPNATVAGIQPVGLAVANASGSSNTFTLTIDGGSAAFTSTTSGTSATYSWDTRPFSNGPHTLGLSVRDAAGNTATTQMTVSVDNNVSSGDVGVTFPNLGPGQSVRGLQNVQIQATNTQGSSNRFEISVDGVVQDLVFTNTTSIGWTWNTMALSNGSHTIAALVVDSTGRSGTNSVFVTVQNGLPVAITGPASGATVSGIAWVDIWVDNPAPGANVFTLTVEGIVVASQSDTGRHVTLPWDTTKTPNGSRTMVAQVRDANNNGGQFTRPVTVQNTVNPPAASFTSPAAGATVSGTVAVGLKATGGTGPYTYRLAVDSIQVFTTTVTATTASYSWNTTSYVNGGHALQLTVTDSRGNSTSATRVVNTQNGALALSASFSAPAAGATVSGTAVNVGVTAAGGSAPYTYRVTVDGTPVFTTSSSATTASFAWDSTKVANGNHALGLTISDNAGGSATDTRTVSVQNDSASALTTSFTSPAAGATVSGSITVGMSAGGGTPGYIYRLTVDGIQIFTTTTSATTAAAAWDTRTVANGSHTLGLTVTDTAGGSATAVRTVTVSNSATGTLQVYITQPTSGTTVSGINWAVIWLGGASGTSNVYTLSVGAQVVGAQTTSSTGPVSIPWDTTTVANGTQALTASVRDATGNTGSTANTVIVQNGATLLSAAFTAPGAGATVGGAAVTITMTGGGGRPAYTYRLTIDGTPVFTTTASTSASFTWNTTTYANGAHTLGLTVTDTAGASAAATRGVSVQNGTPPVTSITSPAASATVSGTTAVNMAVSGGVAPYTYRLTVDGTPVFTTTAAATTATYAWNTTTVANGSHSLGLTVTDSTGAASSVTRTVTVANASGGTFPIYITAPSAGQTVSGTTWVTIWNDSTAAGPRAYTLMVGTTTVWSESVSGNPVSLPWVTSNTPNGTRTLVVTVRDSAGATGTSSLTVTVQNP